MERDMGVLRFGSLAALVLLSGCAWILPKPPVAEATAATAAPACTLDLAEARRAYATTVVADGAAEPMILLLGDGPTHDRLVHSGARVVFRSVASLNDPPDLSAPETAPLTIEAPGGASGTSNPILDRSAVRLSPREGVPPAAAEFVIYKADIPNPNRPTSCDAQLRDGDFVYLRAVAPSAWMRVRDGKLGLPARRSPGPCAAPQERCYTDRYGGLLCVRYLECPADSVR
jgi:hypothetical protein